MKQVTNKKMLDAIKDNDGWIRYRCRLAEYNPSKCAELYQEALICLMMVRDDFDEEWTSPPKVDTFLSVV
jgi:hypothetical protein